MTLGSVLLRPQRVRRGAAPTPEDTLVDDFLSLMARVIANKARGGRILDTMGEALEAAAQRLAQQAEAGVATAHERLRDWLQPFVDRLTQLAQQLSEVDDPAEVMDVAQEVLALVTGLAEGLTADQLRQHLDELLDIARNDLGLTSDFITGQVWALFDDVMARLQALPAESDRAMREDRREVIALLRRVKRRLQGQFQFPELNADRLASELFRWLRRSGFDGAARRVACIGEGVGAAFDAGEAVLRLVPATSIFGPGSVGAAEAVAREKFAWYASWLLGDNDRPWYYTLLFFLPTDEVWIDKDRKNIVRKNVWRDNQVLHTGTDLKWNDAPVFQASSPRHYTFGLVGPDAMEKVAIYSAWIGDYVEAILQLKAIEKGNFASPILNSAAMGALGTYRLITEDPEYPIHSVLRWLTGRTISTLLGSFEGIHTSATFGNAFKFWLILLAADAKNSYTSKSISTTVRDLLLSTLTLLNYQGPGTPPSGEDNRPENRKEVAPWVSLATLGANWLLTQIIPRTDYSHPFQGPGSQAAKMWLLWGLLGSIGTAMVGAVVGTAAGQALARALDWKVLGQQLLDGLLKTASTFWFAFWLTLFGFKEGDTDDGKYNPGGPGFSGYPKHESSPYRLPFEQGKAVMCVQGNQGMWSHNNFGGMPQVYAYDLALDQGDEVLASRPGTVVDFFDWVPDDQNVTTNAPAGATLPGQTSAENWNFIVIRHDLAQDPATGNLVPAAPSNDHDRDQGGAVVTTYAEYGHGRQGSVRRVFAQRLGISEASITSAQIIGQQVRQGQPIMLAGNTGNSFVNHVHIHVRPGPPSSTPPPVARGNLTNRTIPFVFREVTHIIGTDGVPKSLKFYTSDNQRV